MKKYFLFILVVLLVAGFMAGCGKAQPEKVKTGLAVITVVEKSTNAGTEPGQAQIDSAVVAVTVDSKGKIVKCVIDGVQSWISFDATGKILTPLTTVFPTKNELGEAYGMKRASSIGKGWSEQAAAFAKYVEGKTVNEVKNIAVDAGKHPTGSDLKASVTISIGDFITAIEKAVAQAQDLGATAADQLRLGVVTTMANSTNAGQNLGLAEAYSTYVAITQDAQGTITSCVIDATQGRVNFDASGKITTDLTARIKSKNELGEAYGLKRGSSIGKEWNEQAAAFAMYVTGKTPAQVAGITVDASQHPVDQDLKASVTIGIGDFKAALAKAAGC
ncbi:MAG: hypothetical protein GX202_07925 [Firmicutes bacterium]|nr:hypothetical protein [Bacillota bacterium]